MLLRARPGRAARARPAPSPVRLQPAQRRDLPRRRPPGPRRPAGQGEPAGLPRPERHRPGGRADRARHQPAPAGLRLQPGQLLLLLRGRRRPGRDRRRGGEHLRRAPPLPAHLREPGRARRPARLRARQADARLAVLRHGPDLPLLVHRAGRADPRRGRHHRERHPAVLGRAHRAAPAPHQQVARAGPDPLSADVPAGHRPHPLAGGEARDEEGSAAPQAPVRPGRRILARSRRLIAGGEVLARSCKLIPDGGIVERSRNRIPERSGSGRPGRSARAAPAAAGAALPAHPGGAPPGDVGPGASGARPGVGDAARRQHPPRRRPLHGARRQCGCALTQPVAAAGDAGTPCPGRVVRRRRLARRRPGGAARDPGTHCGVGTHQPPGSALHPGPAAPSTAAGPLRPARRQTGHPVPLRPRQRPLRAVPRPVVDLLVRVLRAPRHDAAAGAGGQVPAHLREARPGPRLPRAGDRLRLGAGSRCTRPASGGLV